MLVAHPGMENPIARRTALAGWTALFLYLWFQNSWVGEDAYITGRTVWNALHGYGLRWNVIERVQAYTHPLWMLLLVPLQLVTGDFYPAAVVLSLLCNAAILAVAAGIAARSTHRVALLGAFVLALAGSRAFFDFTSSGLENPLTSLLLLLMVRLDREEDAARTLLVAALAFVNRMDAVLLVLPAAVLSLLRLARRGRARALGKALLATSPAWGWLLFALVYYGFLFPNTAYAKLGTGIEPGALLQHGLAYIRQSLVTDPLTPLAPVAAIGLLARLAPGPRRRGLAALAAGIPLHYAYVVAVGGDFMAGRFLSPAFTLAVGLALAAASEVVPPRALAPGLLVLALYAAVLPHGPVRTFVSYRRQVIDEDGIADEKGHYHFRSSLPIALFRRPRPFPSHRFAEEGLAFRDRPEPVAVECNVGYFGYYAGPAKFVIDVCGLTDPLLARLPARPDFRIGHFERAVPEGYAEAAVSGDAGRLADPGLRAFYAQLLEVTRAEVWSIGRLRTVIAWAARPSLATHGAPAPPAPSPGR
jgi:arabinofuranosyltransferase